MNKRKKHRAGISPASPASLAAGAPTRRRKRHIGLLPPGAFRLLSAIKQREIARRAEPAATSTDQPADASPSPSPAGDLEHSAAPEAIRQLAIEWPSLPVDAQETILTLVKSLIPEAHQ